MNKLGVKIGMLVLMIVMAFSLTASAASGTTVVSYGGTYYNSLSYGEGQAYILPNARTSGTSINIKGAVNGTLKGHYYWSYNGTQLDLGTFVVNSSNYNTGSAYYSPGTLILVLERTAGSTTPYPSMSYSISFN